MRALLNGAIHRKKHKNLLCHSWLWTGSLCRAPSDLKCRCTWAQAEPLHKYQTSFPHGAIKAAAHTETRCISLVICPKLYRVSEATGNKRHRAGLGLRSLNFNLAAFGGRQVKGGLQKHSLGLRCTDFPNLPALF